MLRPIDYWVLGFYLLFMAALGLVFRRFSKNIADYFQGGGKMLWWMTGSSGLMSSVSAWSLTGGAGMAYESGTLIWMLFGSNVLSIFLVYLFSCARFRQMRVITYADAIRRRFGPATEQFYVWFGLPVGLTSSAVALYAVGVFMSAVFGTELGSSILIIGTVVVILSLLGGAWSVVAGDFLQMLLMLLVLVVTTCFVLRAPEVGGVAGFWHHLPASHLHWSRTLRPSVLAIWCPMIFLLSLFYFNNLSDGAARFLSVKDGPNAKKAALMMMVGMAIFMVFILIPPMAAAAVIPDLGRIFPKLANPHEGAFVAMSARVAPPGMMGLLVAALLSATMARMDTGLNRNSGILTRNVYQRLCRPQAGSAELLAAGKGFTLVLGGAIVLLAKLLSLWTTVGLFNLALVVESLVTIPLTIPVVLGLIIWRTSRWAAWSTATLGLSVAWTVRYGVGAARIAAWIAPDRPLDKFERESATVGVTALAVTLVAGGWFLLLAWLRRRRGAPITAEAASLLADMNRPIDPAAENIVYDDRRQYRTMGTLCLCYGGGLSAFAAVPNLWTGRAAFLACGLVIAGIGAGLRAAGRARCPQRLTSDPGQARSALGTTRSTN